MTAYTTIPSSSIDADSVTDVALMTALRDNPIAIAEGDAAAPVIAKVGPNCTGGTQSVNDNSTKLATTAFCEAGFVNNDVGALGVGSFVFAFHTTANTAITAGSTYAGSVLYGAMYDDTTAIQLNSNVIGSGTWRAITSSTANGAGTYAGATFQRIS
jgi:hypothetical protein